MRTSWQRFWDGYEIFCPQWMNPVLIVVIVILASMVISGDK